MARIVVRKAADVWLVERDAPPAPPSPKDTAKDSANGRNKQLSEPAPQRTTDPEVLALATILADVEMWCPDPALRAKLKGAWMIPAAQAMLGEAGGASTVETEWGVRWPALGVVGCESEADARRIVAEQDFGQVTLVSRAVRTVGPWAAPDPA